jgi:dihydrofolate reductase
VRRWDPLSGDIAPPIIDYMLRAYREGRRAVARLIYSVIASVDGYIEDEDGKFDWAEPDEEVHAFINDLTRTVGTHLLGRRMYETMVYWESPPNLGAEPPVVQDFAGIWQSAEKVVYSRTLQTVDSAQTRLERDFDPEAIGRLKATAAGDLTVGGSELAAQAIAAGLVDAFQLFLVPVAVQGGKRAFAGHNDRLNLELLDERRFGNGTVYLHYRTHPRKPPTKGS